MITLTTVLSFISAAIAEEPLIVDEIEKLIALFRGKSAPATAPFAETSAPAEKQLELFLEKR